MSVCWTVDSVTANGFYSVWTVKLNTMVNTRDLTCSFMQHIVINLYK